MTTTTQYPGSSPVQSSSSIPSLSQYNTSPESVIDHSSPSCASAASVDLVSTEGPTCPRGHPSSFSQLRTKKKRITSLLPSSLPSWGFISLTFMCRPAAASAVSSDIVLDGFWKHSGLKKTLQQLSTVYQSETPYSIPPRRSTRLKEKEKYTLLSHRLLDPVYRHTVS